MQYWVFTVIVVAGFIAYLGDWLGRSMGKRRLKLFGLRPRHTAIVVTTVTGVLIASLTLGTLLAVDSQMREVVIHGKELVDQNRSYQAKNSSLRESNLQLVAKSAKLSKEVAKQSAQVARARHAALSAMKARDRAQIHVRALERLIEVRQVELAMLRRTGKESKLRLARISSSLKASMNVLSKVKSDLTTRNRDLNSTQKDLVSKTAELAARMSELTEAQKSIGQARETIRYNEDVMRDQRDAIEREAQRAERLYSSDVVLPQREELVRKVIRTDLSQSQVRAEIVELLDKAGEIATRAGAGADDGKRAIKLVFLGGNNSDITSTDEDTCVDEAAKAIVVQGRGAQVEGVLVRIIVVRNTIRSEKAPKGETALVALQLNWNKMVYRRGDRIARCVIDGKQSEGRVLVSVLDFLRGEVRSSALTHEVALRGSLDAAGADEQISDEQLDHLIDLVQTIRSTGKRVELRALAQKDIYTSGPVNLDNIGFAVSTLVAEAR